MHISEEYRELNRKLHAKGHYGHSGARWAPIIKNFMAKYKCDDVLDYGCGQGELGKQLGNPSWLYEYDPAIEGKDTLPPRADLVVCTDVLEHIEPEFLQATLAYLRDRTKRVLVLNIALTPAVKNLDDGRNAHLIVKDVDWWQEQLEPFFKIEAFDVSPTELFLVLVRQVSIGEFTTKSAVSATIRLEQARLNVPRVTGRVMLSPVNDLTAILCCYGPSLKHTWFEARDRREAGKARIATVSGAHDFLIERGVVPNFHLDCDPREHKARHTEKPHKSVSYLLASCVHPKLIDQIPLEQIYLWHVADDATMEVLHEIDPAYPHAVAGGGSIGLRAMVVLYVLGFRRFEIHGMDCSFENDAQHAAEHFGKPMSVSQVRCGERWFNSSLSMVSYAKYFRTTLNIMQNTSIAQNEPALNASGDRVITEMAGDGLLQEMLRQEAMMEPEVVAAE